MEVETENRKFTVLSFFVLSSMCAYIFYLMLTQVADWTRMGGSNVLGTGLPWQVVGGAIGVLAGLALFIGLSMNRTATSFVDDVFSETKKTTWPAGRDTAISTLVVSVMVIIAALILFLMDGVWAWLFHQVVGVS